MPVSGRVWVILLSHVLLGLLANTLPGLLSKRDSVYFGSRALVFRAVALEMLSQSVLRGLQLLIQEGLSHICQLHAGVLDILGSLTWPKMLVLRQLISTNGLY